MEAVGADWQLATCGWELNAGDLAANPNASVALSALDRGLGILSDLFIPGPCIGPVPFR